MRRAPAAAHAERQPERAAARPARARRARVVVCSRRASAPRRDWLAVTSTSRPGRRRRRSRSRSGASRTAAQRARGGRWPGRPPWPRPPAAATGSSGARARAGPQPRPARTAPASGEEDGEERGGQLDPGRDADAEPAQRWPVRRVRSHSTSDGEQQIDLSVAQRRPHRLAPDGERARTASVAAGRARARAGRQPQDRWTRATSSSEVAGGGEGAHRRHAQQRQRGEQQGGEGRIGVGQVAGRHAWRRGRPPLRTVQPSAR